MLQNITGKRLHNIRKMLNMRQIEIAQVLGIKQNSYSMIENGKSRLTPRNIAALENLLNINPKYLLEGEEPILLSGTKTPTTTSTLPEQSTPQIGIRTIQSGVPLLGQTPNGSELPLHKLAEQEAEYFIDIRPLNGCDFYKQVTAKNMIPQYNPGDIIACRKVENISGSMLLGNNFLCVVSLRDGRYEIMAKLRRTEDDSIILFEPINTSYDAFKISINDILEAYLICGRIEFTL